MSRHRFASRSCWVVGGNRRKSDRRESTTRESHSRWNPACPERLRSVLRHWARAPGCLASSDAKRRPAYSAHFRCRISSRRRLSSCQAFLASSPVGYGLIGSPEASNEDKCASVSRNCSLTGWSGAARRFSRTATIGARWTESIRSRYPTLCCSPSREASSVADCGVPKNRSVRTAAVRDFSSASVLTIGASRTLIAAAI